MRDMAVQTGATGQQGREAGAQAGPPADPQPCPSTPITVRSRLEVSDYAFELGNEDEDEEDGLGGEERDGPSQRWWKEVAPQRETPLPPGPVTPPEVVDLAPPGPVTPPEVVDLAPPGPFIDFANLATGPPCERDLQLMFHVVRLGKIPSWVTPKLVYTFLLARRRDPFPRPLAIKRTISGSGAILIAFASARDAASVQTRLQGTVLPLAKITLEATLVATNGCMLTWDSLSYDVQDEWNRSGKLPAAAWVGLEPPPRRGVSVSEAYATEWNRIDDELRRVERQRDEDARRAEMQRVLDVQARIDEERRWQARQYGRGRSRSVSVCPSCGREPTSYSYRCQACESDSSGEPLYKRVRY